MESLKLGVLGASNHFIKRILHPLQQSSLIELQALASRSEEKAKNIAGKWGIPGYYSSYEELLKDKSIEAVYIPLPNHLHLEWVKKAAGAGKHVICEKPLTMNGEEAKELLEFAKDKQLKIMEAFMYRFHPKWKHAKTLVQQGEIGKIRGIHTIFSYNNTNPANIRNIKDFGGGALMDIGCYAISTARYLLDLQPQRVVSTMNIDAGFKTDVLTSVIMDFGEIKGLFTTATSFFDQQEVKIFGTSGAITITMPFNDFSDIKSSIVVETGLGKRIVEFEPVNQYQLQFEEFVSAIRKNTNIKVSLEESLKNMLVIDAIRKSTVTESWVTL
ncbi:MAG: Gfo/Idh/MocA family oxidoreductase [Spirochaetes bacterium]|nr:Gfo/Idh/MocA family oxidoreductase [Spirochaetota bacterium]